jgi:hypothetical protein
MRTLLCSILLLFLAAPCFAASCNDTQSAANAAMRERNAYARETINTTMPDPEDGRSAFAGCLNSISSIGNIFTLGISFPSLDQLIEGMCRQIDSKIQEKMNEVLNEARSTVNQIGRNNPFQVSAGGHTIGVSISGKLR